MGTSTMEDEARRALALGWAATELLGRYDRRIHPNNPAARKRKLVMGDLPLLSYAKTDPKSSSDLAYALALRLAALVDELKLHQQERAAGYALHSKVKGLASKIRRYQRDAKKTKALGKTDFYYLLEDWSSTSRAQLYARSRELGLCFDVAGRTAKIYWDLPTLTRANPDAWFKESRQIYYLAGDSASRLTTLGEYLPLSAITPLKYTLKRWRTATAKWRKAKVPPPLQEAKQMMNALRKQADIWAGVFLGDKMPEEYLSWIDRLVIHTVSVLIPLIILVAGLVALLFSLRPGWDFITAKVLPQLATLPINQIVDLKLSIPDILKVLSAVVATLGFIIGGTVWLLRGLGALRQHLVHSMKVRLAGRRMLILPPGDRICGRIDRWLREPAARPRTYPRR